MAMHASSNDGRISAWSLSRGEWLPTAIRTLGFEVPGGSSAAALARHKVIESLHELLEPHERNNLELLVSELVTNCVRHADMTNPEDRIKVYAAVAPERLRLEVLDTGPGFSSARPTVRDFNDGHGGLGLVLLDRIATAWGVDLDDRFSVWAEFEREQGDGR
jgi:anti-sigma regulatory factor (Ser/Thr protein kinase)